MKRMLSAVAAIAVVALIGFASVGEETYADISLEDLKKAIEAKSVTLIDCNGTETYTKSHIPGAKDFKAVEMGLHQTVRLQPRELAVDLLVGGIPEVADRAVEALRQIGARARLLEQGGQQCMWQRHQVGGVAASGTTAGGSSVGNSKVSANMNH